MKKLVSLFSLLSIVLLNTTAFAQDDKDNENKSEQKKYDFVKNKSVNKSYNVSSSDKLNIDNQFGKVEVKTWDRNEIKVDVDIEVSATTEAAAQKLIDNITVDDGQRGGDISFKTNMKGNDRKTGEGGNNNEKSTMHINYTVSMPASNPLRISN